MEQLVKGLETVLENELVIHEQLLEAARTMNQAIKAEDLAGVKKAARKHDELTCQIEALEEKRLTANDALALHLGVKNHATLTRLIDNLPADHKTKLSKLKTDLKRVIWEFKRINSSNQILLTESLRTVAKVFEFIDCAMGKLSGYKFQGKKSPIMITRTIINTVA
jgi:FlgN protein.